MNRSKEKLRPWSAPILRPGCIRIMTSRRRFYCTADDFRIRKKHAAGMHDKMQLLEKVATEMNNLRTALASQRLNPDSEHSVEENNNLPTPLKHRSRSSSARTSRPLLSNEESLLTEAENTGSHILNGYEDNLDYPQQSAEGADPDDCPGVPVLGTGETPQMEENNQLGMIKEEPMLDTITSEETRENEAVTENVVTETAPVIENAGDKAGDDIQAVPAAEPSPPQQQVQDRDTSDVMMEMTFEEKQAVYEVVKQGDIDLLEDLLDLPNADIRMEWYDQNLLMIAIQSGQAAMAEFLLDNGVDQTFEGLLLEMNIEEENEEHCNMYRVSCRQMAYDRGMMDIVDIIDIINGEYPRYLKPREREVRLRRPKPPPESESVDGSLKCGSHTTRDENCSGIEQQSSNGAKNELKTAKDGIITDNKKMSKKKKISIIEDKEPCPPEESMERMELVDEWRKFKCEPEGDTVETVAGNHGYPSWTKPTTQEAAKPQHYRGTKSFSMRKKQSSLKSSTSSEDKFVDRRKVNCAGSYDRESRRWMASNGSPTNKNRSISSKNVSGLKYNSVSDTTSMYSSACSLSVSRTIYGSFHGSHYGQGSSVTSGRNGRKTQLSVEKGPIYDQSKRSWGPSHLWNPNQRI